MRTFKNHPEFEMIIETAERKLNAITNRHWRINAFEVPANLQEEKTLRNVICEVFEVYWKDIQGKNRRRKIVDARHTYSYFAFKYLGFSSTNIAENLQGHHTSVLHGVNKVTTMIACNDPLKDLIVEVKTKLFPNETQA